MWNPAVIFDGMTDGIRRIGAGGDRNLVSFGLDSWGSDGVWLSRDGDVAYPSYSCHSPSFTGALAEIEPLVSSRERYTLTGVFPDDFLVVN